ncbi:hypothetical protein [Herbidospora cretacea]|uniref:hypothetical protein n=1 Tax=Herbidospora cretacea TaxID=28444 RepID=UPI0007737DFF|nr:hypothetical protein [Herbidospora cretacea]
MSSHYNPWWGKCGHIPGNGTARSVINNDNQTWTMYAGEYGRKTCEGRDVDVPPGTSDADLGFDATNWG